MSLEAAEAIHLYRVASAESKFYMPNVGRAWADALDNFYYTQIAANFDLANPAGTRQESLKSLLQGILKQHPDMSEADIYIAGPQSANEITEQFFLDLGLPKTRVFTSA